MNVVQVFLGGGRGGEKEHLKAKIDELETKSKIKNMKLQSRWKLETCDLYMGIKGYQPRTNIVKDERVIWLERLPKYYG